MMVHVLWRIPDLSRNTSRLRYNFLLGVLGDDLEGVRGGDKGIKTDFTQHQFIFFFTFKQLDSPYSQQGKGNLQKGKSTFLHRMQ